VAKEQAERRATAQLMFDLGQKAYGKGSYGRAIEFLEAALTIIPRPTLFGGEVGSFLPRLNKNFCLIVLRGGKSNYKKLCISDSNMAGYGL